MLRILCLALALCFCAVGHGQTTLPSLHKRVGSYLPRSSATETSIVNFNGRLITITFWRASLPSYIKVVDFDTATVLAQWNWPAAFGTPIVANGALYIVGSQEIVGGPNSIVISQLDPNTFAPSTPQVLWTSSGQRIDNVGIAYNGSQFVVMAQTDAPPAYFLASSTITGPYAPIGSPYAYPNLGPWKIYYLNGYYYMPMQAAGTFGGVGKFYGVWARSPDLVNWTISPTTWVFPDYPQEGVNASDTTCAELNGLTYCLYFDGDQQTWSEVHSAIYNGTFAQLLANFF